MSGWRDVSLVAGREIRQRLRGKWFVISTLVLVVLVVGAGVVSRLAQNDESVTDVTVAVVGDAPPGFGRGLQRAAPQLDLAPKLTSEPNVAAGRSALADGEVDVVIDTVSQRALYADAVDRDVDAVVQQAWSGAALRSGLRNEGLTAADIDRTLATTSLRSSTVDAGGSEPGVGNVIGLFAAILLFLALQTYGSFILMGVVEEKSSAVIEVLLGRVGATRLLAGKVLGIGAIALGQFAIVMAASAGALLIAGTDVPGEVWGALPWTVVWFLGGFALYAFLFALAGSLVSRQEDAQSAVLPVTAILLVAYFAVFRVVGEPDGGAATVMSLIPPFAPLLMPLRIATGSAAWYEIAVSLVLLLLAVAGVAALSGRIYTRLVLQRGARIGWMQAFRRTH